MMADELYLLNLDTGDFIKLGRQVGSGYGVPTDEYDGVPEVGYGGDHLLVDSLPLITGEKQSEPTPDSILEIRRRRGHALNAFLAMSPGCRLMVLNGSMLFDSIQGAAREFHDLNLDEGVFVEILGQLGSTSVGSGPVGDDGKPISEGSFFYQKRLSRPRWRETPNSEEDKQALKDKRSHYDYEIKRALSKNIVRKLNNKGEYEWVYSMGQSPVELTIED